jgi:predicted DNA-binding ribbon-helix-helix protein
MWCIILEVLMAAKSKAFGRPHDTKTTRASVSFPSDLYETLEQIARDKKVSVAWIVRDAAERYVSEKWPLFGGRE